MLGNNLKKRVEQLEQDYDKMNDRLISLSMKIVALEQSIAQSPRVTDTTEKGIDESKFIDRDGMYNYQFYKRNLRKKETED